MANHCDSLPFEALTHFKTHNFDDLVPNITHDDSETDQKTLSKYTLLQLVGFPLITVLVAQWYIY